MKNRCRIIDETGADLTVSIHQNSYTDPGVKGPQVFYYEHSEEVRNDIELAIDENKNETEEFLTEDDYRLDLKCNGDVY